MSTFLFIVFMFFTSSSSVESRKDLRDAGANEEAVIQLRHSDHYDRINPSRVVQLSWRPRVFLYKGLLSNEECDHLTTLARGSEENQLRNDDDSRNDVAKRLLSVKEMSLSSNDNIVRRIEERISTWTLLPEENSKPLRISHYGPEEANKNYQYFGNQSISDVNQPLMATVILYLSNVTQGGNILFPNSESPPLNKVWSDCARTIDGLGPVKGNAILFFSVHPNASPDGTSSHARCPVLKGEMWYAVKFFYIKAVNKENVFLDWDDNDCNDEHDNCVQWAAFGECQRNPTYMIGTPDYYGACRKSCNACQS